VPCACLRACQVFLLALRFLSHPLILLKFLQVIIFFSFYDMGSCHLSMPLYNFCSWSLVWSLQAVKTGDTIFIGQYLFTGSETTSVWLEVSNFIEACHVTYFSRQACLSQIIIISLM
jgi:hypothetical protein